MADQVPQVQVVRSPNFQDIYSNQTYIALSGFDATVTFSRLVNFAGNNVVEELASVRVSPQALKVLAETLTNATAAWEAEFGHIETKEIPVNTVDLMRKGVQAAKASVKSMRAAHEETLK